MVATLILERSATLHPYQNHIYDSRDWGKCCCFLLHGSTLTKIGNINQIFQCTIKKAADLALKQVHCYNSTYSISLHNALSPSSNPQNKFNCNTILKNFIHTCSTWSHFKPGKKKIILHPTKGLWNFARQGIQLNLTAVRHELKGCKRHAALQHQTSNRANLKSSHHLHIQTWYFLKGY